MNGKMEDQIFNQLKEFVIRERLGYEFELTRDTDLQRDLKIWGDDADDFIESFSREFNVDISEFEISKYFKSEGDWILPKIMSFFFGKKTEQYPPLRLGNLEKAIKEKKMC
jgi:hypothetical protein